MRQTSFPLNLAFALLVAMSTATGCSKQTEQKDSPAATTPSSSKSGENSESAATKEEAGSVSQGGLVISSDPAILPADLSPVVEPIFLRHQLPDGLSLSYLIRSSTVATNDEGGRFEESEGTKIRIEATKVADGERVPMKAYFDELAMKLISPGTEFTFDSRSNDIPAGPLGNILGPILQTITSGPITFTIDPLGSTENVEFPAAFRSAIAANEMLSQVGITEKTFEQMIRSALVPLSNEGVASGMEWSQVEEATAFGPGITHAAEYEFRGTIESPGGGAWAVITFEGKTSGQGQSGSAIDSVDVITTGQMYFDIERGRLEQLTSISQGTMNTNVQGKLIQQSLRGSTTVRRIE